MLPENGWAELGEILDTVIFDEGHHSIMKGDAIKEIASYIERCTLAS